MDNWQEKALSYTVPEIYTFQKDIEKLINNEVDKKLKGSQAQFHEDIFDSDENNSEHIESHDEKTNSLSSHPPTTRQSKQLQNAKSKSQDISVSNGTVDNASAEGHNHSS